MGLRRCQGLKEEVGLSEYVPVCAKGRNKLARRDFAQRSSHLALHQPGGKVVF